MGILRIRRASGQLPGPQQPVQISQLGKRTNPQTVFVGNFNLATGKSLAPALAATPRGLGGKVVLTDSTSIPLGVAVAASWMLLLVVRRDAQGSFPYFLGVLNGGNYAYALTGQHASVGNRMAWYDGVGFQDSGFAQPIGDTDVIGLTFDGATNRYRWYKNGRAYGSTVGANNGGSGVWQLAAVSGESNTNTLPLLVIGANAASPADMLALTGNPARMFDAPALWLTSTSTTPNSYTLTTEPGNFTLTGSAASIRASRKFAGSNGSFNLTGNAATLRAARKVSSAAGVITLAGGAAGLAASRKVVAAPGAFALAGAAVSIRAARAVAASAGAFAVAGPGAVIRASRRLTGAPAAFTLTGSDARLSVARRLAAAAGAFTLTGGAAQLVYSPVVEGNVLFTETGQFVLTGSAVGMRVTRRLQAQPGSFELAGSAAAITYTPSAIVAVDISKISPARIVVFEGSGSRVVPFDGSGSRVTPFDSSGIRVVVFEGSGSKTVRFE